MKSLLDIYNQEAGKKFPFTVETHAGETYIIVAFSPGISGYFIAEEANCAQISRFSGKLECRGLVTPPKKKVRLSLYAYKSQDNNWYVTARFIDDSKMHLPEFQDYKPLSISIEVEE